MKKKMKPLNFKKATVDNLSAMELKTIKVGEYPTYAACSFYICTWEDCTVTNCLVDNCSRIVVMCS